MCQCELSSGSFFRVDRVTLPPCVSPDLNANGCNCSPSRPQVSRQWPGHPYPGPSTLFANPSTTTPSRFAFPQFPSTSFHHAGAPHEPTKLHDPRNLHGTQGYTNIPRTLFPQTLYNNPHSPNPASQTHYYRPPANAIPPAMQGVPSPSNHRKRKNNTTGRGGARKRQQQPAPIVTAPTSAKFS
jgi:hypothetical protein